MMKTYSSVLPPEALMSCPAALADPPVAIKSLSSASALKTSLRDVRSRDSLHHDTLLPLLNRALLHLKHILSILFRIHSLVRLPWEFAGFAHGDEGRPEAHGQNRPEEESTGVKTDNHIGLGGVVSDNVVQEVSDQSLKGDGVPEDGEDVEEGDSLSVSFCARCEPAAAADKEGSSVVLTALGKPGWTPSRLLRCATSDIV